MNTKKNSKQIRQQKKELITGQPNRRLNMKPIAIAVVVLAIAAGAGFYFTNHTLTTPGPAGVVSTGKTSAGITQISFPLSDFADGKARHYSFDFNGMTINYFILKSSDGVVRAAFDACDVCWRAGKGYVQQGDVMICRNCGRRFASVRINEVQGGCNPAPLQRSIEGDQLVIQVQDIQDGRNFFDFSGNV